MNLEDPEQVVALAADLEKLGYYNSPLQSLLEQVVATVGEMAMQSCIQGLPDPISCTHYNRGLMNGARAVTQMLQDVRKRALVILEGKARASEKTRERELPLGGGTLS